MRGPRTASAGAPDCCLFRSLTLLPTQPNQRTARSGGQNATAGATIGAGTVSLFFTAGGGLSLSFTDATGVSHTAASPGAALTNGTWTFVAVTASLSATGGSVACLFYINGALIGAGGFSGAGPAWPDYARPFGYFGLSLNTSAPMFTGYLAELVRGTRARRAAGRSGCGLRGGTGLGGSSGMGGRARVMERGGGYESKLG